MKRGNIFSRTSRLGGSRPTLSANMSETVTPWKFSVEGEARIGER